MRLSTAYLNPAWICILETTSTEQREYKSFLLKETMEAIAVVQPDNWEAFPP